jgi:hypothetical protein
MAMQTKWWMGVFLVGFVVAGCDYGTEWDGELADPGSWEESVELQGALENEPVGSGIVLPFMEQMPVGHHPKMTIAREDILVNAAEDDESQGTGDACDCSEYCAACADAYICGHESEIASVCQSCAQCQANCATKSK